MNTNDTIADLLGRLDNGATISVRTHVSGPAQTHYGDTYRTTEYREYSYNAWNGNVDQITGQPLLNMVEARLEGVQRGQNFAYPLPYIASVTLSSDETFVAVRVVTPNCD